MTNERPRPDAIPVERIDADAVCERCGSVSAEDTLLCKTCGNNLRDQRLRRVTGQAGVDIPGLAPERIPWVRGALAVLGILVIIWVAININNIENWLAGAQTSTGANGKTYWSGPDRAIFDELAADLSANPVTKEEGERATQRQTTGDTYDGRYVLVQQGPARPLVVGQANVRKDGDTLRFVAVLTRTNAEVRGEARLEGGARIAARDSAGLKLNGEYYGASGFAQRIEGGGIECFGLTSMNDESYSAIAYRIQ